MGPWPLALKYQKLGILILWLTVLFISLKAHTPWRDEYQSWLVSTRTPDLTSFFDGIRYERHPPLHYLLQRGMARFVPSSLEWSPKIAIEAITVPFSVGAAIILIFAVGLTPIQSFLLIFGPYFFREFSLISRCYALGLFFLLAATALAQRKRYSFSYAALALGSLTHLLFSWVCGAIFVLLALGDRRRFRDVNFYLSGLILLGAAALQIPPADSLFTSSPRLDHKSIFGAFKILTQSLWGLEKVWSEYQWNTQPLATDITVVLLIPALMIIRSRLNLSRFLWVCLPPVVLIASTYAGSTRYLGVTFFGFVACHLIFARPSADYRWRDPLTVFPAVALVSTLYWWLSWGPYKDRPNFDFSATRELIEKTQNLVSEGVLLVENDVYFFSWMAETKSTFFNMRRDELARYPHFKTIEYKFADAPSWCDLRLADFKKKHAGKNLYFGSTKDSQFPKECGPAKKIFSSTRRSVTDESFDLYLLTGQ